MPVAGDDHLHSDFIPHLSVKHQFDIMSDFKMFFCGIFQPCTTESLVERM